MNDEELAKRKVRYLDRLPKVIPDWSAIGQTADHNGLVGFSLAWTSLRG